jgi:hypothetical protein
MSGAYSLDGHSESLFDARETQNKPIKNRSSAAMPNTSDRPVFMPRLPRKNSVTRQPAKQRKLKNATNCHFRLAVMSQKN